MRRQLRFVITADLCRAWGPFGGLAAQISHFAILVSISSEGDWNYAILYHMERARLLADSARARIPLVFRRYLFGIKGEVCEMISNGSTMPNRPNTAPNPANRDGETLPVVGWGGEKRPHEQTTF